MKKFKEFSQLYEAFNNPYGMHIDRGLDYSEYSKIKAHNGMRGKFKTDANLIYQIDAYMVARTKKERETIKAYEDKVKSARANGQRPPMPNAKLYNNGGMWEVHFNKMDADGNYHNDITGDGDQFRVFATVFDFIKTLVKEHNPVIISIKSKTGDKSRVKLYNTLTKRYAGQIGYKVVKIVSNNDLTRIELKRNDSLKEEWYQTYKVSSLREPLDIYKNPTRKEMKEMADADYGVFRALLMDDGTMYAWSKAIHHQAHKALKINNNFIPVEIAYTGRSGDITVTDYINNSTWKNKKSEVADKIRNHRHYNKVLGSSNIFYYNGKDWENS